MTWLKDLSNSLTSTDKTGWVKQLYNWQMPGVKSEYYPSGKASLKELYSPEGMQKGGKFIREAGLSRGVAFGKGMFGITDASKTGGEPWSDQYNPFKWIDDQKADAAREYEKRMKQFTDGVPKMPDPSEASQFIKDIIPEMPDVNVDLEGFGGELKEGMNNFSLALASGLAAMGQGVGGGLEGAMPSMPSISLGDEEGEPNILLLGGLAAVAYVVLKGVTK